MCPEFSILILDSRNSLKCQNLLPGLTRLKNKHQTWILKMTTKPTFIPKMGFLCAIAMLGAATVPAMGQDLSGLNLGAAANYAFVDLGPTTLGWNSGPIAGSVLFGQGLTANLSGGNNGGLTAGHVVDVDPTATVMEICKPNHPSPGIDGFHPRDQSNGLKRFQLRIRPHPDPDLR